MESKYKVITLCGSTRFKDAFIETQKRLTLEGNIVISVGLFGHSGDDEVWENMDEGTRTKTKMMLDDMHKSKIDMADEIYVINVGGYIGESTRSEIDYAKSKGKAINYLEKIGTGQENEADELISEARKSEENGDIEQSIRLLWTALSKNPNEKQLKTVIRAIIGYCIDIGRTDKAEQFYNYAEQTYGQDAILQGACIRLSFQKLAEGDRTAAIKYARVAQGKTPGKMSPLLLRLYHSIYPEKQEQKKEDSPAAVPVKQDENRAATISKESKKKKKRQLRGRPELPEDRERRKQILIDYNKKQKLKLEKQQKQALEHERERLRLEASRRKEEANRKPTCDDCVLYRREDCAGIGGLCKDFVQAPYISQEERDSWPTEMGPYVTGYSPKNRR